jgi:hypothetical protein
MTSKWKPSRIGARHISVLRARPNTRRAPSCREIRSNLTGLLIVVCCLVFEDTAVSGAPSFKVASGANQDVGADSQDPAIQMDSSLGMAVCPIGFGAGKQISRALAVSDPQSRAGQGVVFLVREETVDSPTRILGPSDVLGWGHSLESGPDWNGDGVSDFAVSAVPPTIALGLSKASVPEGYFKGGIVALCSGTDGAVIRRIDGDAGTSFGVSLAIVGDIDGDGARDLVIGQLGGRPPGSSGQCTAVSASSGKRLYTIKGSRESPEFAMKVVGLGDIDDDNINDYAVCAPVGLSHPKKLGYVSIRSSKSGRELRQISSPEGVVAFAGSCAFAAGVGGKKGALIVGCQDVRNGGGVLQRAEVNVYDCISGERLYRIDTGRVPAEARPGFGASFVVLKDIDEDDVADYAILSQRVMDPEPGAICIISGNTGAVLESMPVRPGLGLSACGQVDWDGDGACEVVLGSGSILHDFARAGLAIFSIPKSRARELLFRSRL